MTDTPKALSAEEEARWRTYAYDVRGLDLGEKMRRIFASLDAARAEAERLRGERDEAQADQATLDRVLAAFGIANTHLDAGNYAKALCVGLRQLRALAAELVEGLVQIERALCKDSRDKSIGAETVEYHLDGQAMYGAINGVRTLLTKAHALGIGSAPAPKGEKGEG